MAEADRILCNDIYVNFRGKLRRYSCALDKPIDSPDKRQKAVRCKRRRQSICNGEDSNFTFSDSFDINAASATNPKAKTASKEKLTLGDIDLQKFSKIKVPRNKPQETTTKKPSKPKIPRMPLKNTDASLVVEDWLTSRDEFLTHLLRTCLKKKEVNLNTAFIAEDIEDQEESKANKRRNERRLSGRFPKSLNTAFIDDTDLKENAQDNYNWDQNNFLTAEVFPAPEPLAPNNDSNKTPIKSKLRNKATKPTKEEDIIKYYTDKTIKTRQNTLETIFETPTLQEMSVRKYRRFISFNERMSKPKMKKRHMKVENNKMWKNENRVSMDHFESKMAEVEAGL